MLLRTHTSPVQVRTLQRYPPPIRILAPGNVYRRDFFDASHAPMFAQIEGLCVDEGISFVDLKATLDALRRSGSSASARTRFRPQLLPVHRAVGRDGRRVRLCRGAGCAACKGTGWMEILGSGMVHPAVLDAAGLDSEKYTGWAFGMGPARIAQQRYGMPDIRRVLRFRRPLPGADRRMNVSYEWLRAFVPFDADAGPVARSDHRARRDGGRVGASARRTSRRSSWRAWSRRRRTPTPTTCTSPRWTTAAASCSTSCAAPPTSRPASCTRSRAPARRIPDGVKLEKRKIRGADVQRHALLGARAQARATTTTASWSSTSTCPRARRCSRQWPIGDTQLVIDVLPNRPDLLSHLGVAREVARGHRQAAGAAGDRR